MKNSIFGTVIVVAMFAASPGPGAAQDMDEINEAIAKLREADSSIESFFSQSAGYALFPSVGKGGFGIGGARGGGVVFRDGAVIGKVKLTQISIGFQIGGQKFIEAIFFRTDAALEDFIGGNFEFNAQVSAVALHSGASRDAEFQNDVVVFTLTKGGLMYEAAVGGQKFSFEANQDDSGGAPPQQSARPGGS